jgi:hypothetical protein
VLGCVTMLLVLAGPARAETRATFLSTTSEAWDVAVDGEVVCATPCTQPLAPHQFIVLRSQEARPILLEVGRLPPGDLVVTGKPLEGGKYAGGIVATTLGGMALVTGITLSAVGLATDRNGMSLAGFISGGVGALTTVGGIYLMLTAVPTFSVGGVTGVGVGGRF